MAVENQAFLPNFRYLEGKLGRPLLQLGDGGEGSVWLHELEKDGVFSKVAVKSVTFNDENWKKYGILN